MVLIGVMLDMDVWLDEVFGFVIIVMFFDSEDEVVVMVNDMFYGLFVFVVIGDVLYGEFLVECIYVGMVYVNDLIVYDELYCFFLGIGVLGGGGKWGLKGVIEVFIMQCWILIQCQVYLLLFQV